MVGAAESETKVFSGHKMKYTVEASDMSYNDDDSLLGSSASIINTDEELIKKRRFQTPRASGFGLLH